MRVAFLHIPKTAGQSVHHSLISLFNQDEICPARTNKELYTYTINELAKYNLFSGHLDWSVIRLTGNFDYVFTVLRDPLDRILSFYFYLRQEAMRLQQLGEPIGAGMKAALEYTPKQYFTEGDAGMRSFLDNHYNNFYSYYFASGSYSGFSQLSNIFPPGSKELLDLARLGMKSLDAVYTMSTLPRLNADIKRIFDVDMPIVNELNANRHILPAKRHENMTLLSGAWDWKASLDRLTESDCIIFDDYSS